MTLAEQAATIYIDASRVDSSCRKFQAVPIVGKAKSNRSGRIKFFSDNVAYCKNHISGEECYWFENDPVKRALDAQTAKFAKTAAILEQKRINDEHQKSALRAHKIWEASKEADPYHPYLKKKKLDPIGLKKTGDCLLLPVLGAKDDSIQSLQFIYPNGNKRFLSGGKIQNGYFSWQSNQSSNHTIFIGEGWATMATLSQKYCLNGLFICAFSSANLANVALACRQRGLNNSIIIVSDNDANGVGQKAANVAAKITNSNILMPDFDLIEREQLEACSDWWDRWSISEGGLQ
jgi:putative DNA primase/helicase